LEAAMKGSWTAALYWAEKAWPRAAWWAMRTEWTWGHRSLWLARDRGISELVNLCTVRVRFDCNCNGSSRKSSILSWVMMMVSATGLMESSGIGLVVAVSKSESGSSVRTVTASESVESETEVESRIGSDGGTWS
jgi:hypothetical protein